MRLRHSPGSGANHATTRTIAWSTVVFDGYVTCSNTPGAPRLGCVHHQPVWIVPCVCIKYSSASSEYLKRHVEVALGPAQRHIEDAEDDGRLRRGPGGRPRASHARPRAGPRGRGVGHGRLMAKSGYVRSQSLMSDGGSIGHVTPNAGSFQRTPPWWVGA